MSGATPEIEEKRKVDAERADLEKRFGPPRRGTIAARLYKMRLAAEQAVQDAKLELEKIRWAESRHRETPDLTQKQLMALVKKEFRGR
jgi:hypothetical protein